MTESPPSYGKLCLELINTVSWRNGPNRHDKLESPAALAGWARKLGLLDTGQARELEADTARGGRSLAEAAAVRELLFRLFAAVAAGGSPGAEDLEDFNARLGPTMGRACLIQSPGGYAWGFRSGRKPLDRILDPVLRSAADLLVSPDLSRLKICAEASCGWLFFDRSRNRSRRWCDMRDCGNRAKARSYYRRQSSTRTPRQAAAPPGDGG